MTLDKNFGKVLKFARNFLFVKLFSNKSFLSQFSTAVGFQHPLLWRLSPKWQKMMWSQMTKMTKNHKCQQMFALDGILEAKLPKKARAKLLDTWQKSIKKWLNSKIIVQNWKFTTHTIFLLQCFYHRSCLPCGPRGFTTWRHVSESKSQSFHHSSRCHH